MTGLSRFCIFKRLFKSMDILKEYLVWGVYAKNFVYNFQNRYIWVALFLQYFVLPYNLTLQFSKFMKTSFIHFNCYRIFIVDILHPAIFYKWALLFSIFSYYKNVKMSTDLLCPVALLYLRKYTSLALPVTNSISPYNH